MLVGSTLGLSLPLILRGTCDYLNQFDWYCHIKDSNEHLWQLIFFFIGDVIPLSLQLTSLVFGYIRSKVNKKSRLEAKLDNSGEFTSGRDFLSTSKQSTSNVSNNLSDTQTFFDPPLEDYVAKS